LSCDFLHGSPKIRADYFPPGAGSRQCCDSNVCSQQEVRGAVSSGIEQGINGGRVFTSGFTQFLVGWNEVLFFLYTEPVIHHSPVLASSLESRTPGAHEASVRLVHESEATFSRFAEFILATDYNVVDPTPLLPVVSSEDRLPQNANDEAFDARQDVGDVAGECCNSIKTTGLTQMWNQIVVRKDTNPLAS